MARVPLSRIGGVQLAPLALLVVALAAMSLPSASAQATEAPLPTEATSPTPSTLATSITGSGVLSSLSGTAGTASSILSTSFSRPTSIDNAPDTFNNDDDSRDGMDDRRGGMINYYFVFLALFIVLAFLGVYFLNRRRQARKEAWLASGQHALRRDMDGWTSNARRWQRQNEANRRDGLDEFGQAPPPYVAKQDVRVEEREDGLQIPLRTLPRDERQRDMAKPPEYMDAVIADSSVGQQPVQGSSTGSTSPATGATNSQQAYGTRPS